MRARRAAAAFCTQVFFATPVTLLNACGVATAVFAVGMYQSTATPPLLPSHRHDDEEPREHVQLMNASPAHASPAHERHRGSEKDLDRLV